MRPLIVRLLYRTGLRVMECSTLRVRDLDFDRGQIIDGGSKGGQGPGRDAHATAVGCGGWFGGLPAPTTRDRMPTSLGSWRT